MKSPHLVKMLTVSVLSAVLGYGFGSTRQDVAKKGSDPRDAGRHPQNRSVADASRTEESMIQLRLRALLGESSLSPASAHRTTTRALEEKDPARRLAALGLIVDSMTPETASSIRQAFIDSTINTGRRNDEAWFTMVRKFGELLGPAALDQIKPDNSLEKALALEGWAMADSDAALAHLRTMDRSESGYSESCAALLTGIAKVDPGKSFQIILSDPDLDVNFQTLVTSSVQSLGIDGATQTLQSALDRADPEAAQSFAFRAIFNELADTMMHQNWTSGHSDKVLPWLEQQKGQPFLTNQVLAHAAQDVALQGKMSEALDWLDRMNDQDSKPSLGRSGIRSAVMKDPSLLSNLDEDTFGRVMEQFPPNSPEMKVLADAIEPLKPAYASKLRAAGP